MITRKSCCHGLGEQFAGRTRSGDRVLLESAPQWRLDPAAVQRKLEQVAGDRVAFKEAPETRCFEVEGKKAVPCARFGARRGRIRMDLNELRAASMKPGRIFSSLRRGSAR